MEAVAVNPDKQRVEMINVAAPTLTGPTQVKLRMLEVGVCGTDREIVGFEYGTPPPGEDDLIIGHESLAEVVEVGKGVSPDELRPGDLAVVMVRRPCPHPECTACRSGRSDFCYTGDFTERGIKGVQGFMTEEIVDEAQYIVRVPAELRDVAVLVEPLTIAEKALNQIRDIQRRLPWACPVSLEPPMDQGAEYCHRAVVLGAGPVGLLGAMRLAVAGFQTFVYSQEPADGPKAQITNAIGATYLSAQDVPIEQLSEIVGNIDTVYEAAGASRAAFELIQELGVNGVYCFTGVPGRKGPAEVDTATIMRNLVLKNQVVFGTVNAGRPAFEEAVHSLGEFVHRWPEATRSLITGRYKLGEAVDLLRSGWSGIKNVIEIG